MARQRAHFCRDRRRATDPEADARRVPMRHMCRHLAARTDPARRRTDWISPQLGGYGEIELAAFSLFLNLQTKYHQGPSEAIGKGGGGHLF